MADFYIRSAASLDRVLRDECSVKAAASVHPDSGRVLAILVNSLAYRNALMYALEETRVIKIKDKTFTLHSPPVAKGKALSSNLKKGKRKEWPSKEAFLLVLCHDLLFQSRGIQASKTWPPKLTLEKYKPSLHSSLVKLQIRTGKSRISELRSGALYQEMTARIPRWIRINDLRCSREQLFSWLTENKYTKVDGPELGGVREFMESKHVPGLLAFHPKATSGLLASVVYKENWIVMQDLASCFPAFILDPPREALVIDATSAPGNKTSHLSALMHSKTEAVGDGGEKGRVYAFERDAVRYKTLVKRLSAVGALHPELGGKRGVEKKGNGNVLPERKDFLTTKPSDFAKVTHMLVDPSCSGSGIVNRLDFLKEDDDSEDPLPNPNSSNFPSPTPSGQESEAGGMTKMQHRLAQLSSFQLLLLRHAFKFLSLHKLVYSTCSIHTQENEEVVFRALDSDEAKQRGWKLSPRKDVIPTWPVRGDKEVCEKWGKRGEEIREGVIRCVPGGTGGGNRPNGESCNGFFVACFVREQDGEDGKVGVKRMREDDAVEDERGSEIEEDEQDEGKKDGEEEQGRKEGANTAANRKKKLQKKRKKQRLQRQQS